MEEPALPHRLEGPLAVPVQGALLPRSCPIAGYATRSEGRGPATGAVIEPSRSVPKQTCVGRPTLRPA